ncbi:longevity assurance proteins LAG1/LAC1 [Artomyces pyxidatus]|uniref:Longevity assurance proteins LAG1/LAC1 n=1 Tax=Artomyces pyxidatus TaxID=48021 RepID=A0ACB8TJJ6_9AGAM|nr:longevity assurance proteins LAG1/LAC1 [Artomyces pyxidatus]
MSQPTVRTRRGRSGTISRIETDPSHHLAGPFMPQTPLDSPTDNIPPRVPRPLKNNGAPSSHGFLDDLKTFRWVVVPQSSLRMILLPVFLHIQWTYITPLLFTDPPLSPFAPLLFLSHPTPSPTGDPNDVRYRKGYLDLVFLAYHIIVFSFLRQVAMIYICYPVARYFGIKREAKLARFGEQGYAILYFGIFGLWGMRIMGQLPTWWYNVEAFWIDYPHWQMKPELKRYYLMQASYWCQQLIVLVFKLEKPRKDYNELVAHHIVTLWLVGWSYLINLTLIGNAVYMSMDIPDAFLGTSKILNYMRWDRTKIAVFAVFIFVWTYFRHYLNLVMLWSVYRDFDLIPETSKVWAPETGAWLVWWMKWQIFAPILLLQLLNLFWYFLILRILVRAFTDVKVTDERSDDEESYEEEDTPPKTNKRKDD